jgi:hypothetical protein
LILCTAEAQKSEKQAATGTQVWILTSILPEKYRSPTIIPAQDPAYVGLYTFIIATILLMGGTLPEPKLERYLQRTNADTTTPVDKTDKLLQRLIKEQYIVKIKDTSSGEEMVEYRVGPRGKVEIDKEGVAALVRSVYGYGVEGLEKKLQRSLELGDRAAAPAQGNGNENAEDESEAGPATQRRSTRRQPRDDDDDGSESEE